MTQQAAPPTMRAVELHDVDDLRVVERPTPRAGPGELLVRVTASGICSGDLMPWYVRRKAPLTLGHEPVGEIVAVGAGATSPADGHAYAAGERVAIHHHAPCFACAACARGAYVQCATWRSSAIDPGGIAEYVRVPAVNLGDTLVLPAGVEDAAAVFVEPLGCVMKSLRRARLYGGDVVAVVGLGVMGLLHVAVLAARGYTVVASDPNPARRALAEALGADAAVDPADAEAAYADRGAPDVVICGPGTSAALDAACRAVAPAGTVVMFTPLPPGEPYALDQASLYFRDVTLTASYSCGPNDTREALAWIVEHALDPAAFGARLYPLARTPEAYRAMAGAEIVKAIVRP